MAAPTLYQKRTAAKRGARDITRLAEQYKSGVQSITSEYERAFGAYQTKTAETLAPYEAAIKKYQESTLPQYESAAATYEAKAKEYQNQIANYNSYVQSFYDATSSGPVKVQLGSGYYEGFFADYGSGIQNKEYIETPSGYQFVQTGSEADWLAQPGERIRSLPVGYLAKPGSAPLSSYTQKTAPAAFTEKAPAAPEAPPSAPTIEPFSDEPFQQKRAALESEFQREVGERKSARLSAVSRRSARPLMQG
jgi:hypothetical protein